MPLTNCDTIWHSQIVSQWHYQILTQCNMLFYIYILNMHFEKIISYFLSCPSCVLVRHRNAKNQIFEKLLISLYTFCYCLVFSNKFENITFIRLIRKCQPRRWLQFPTSVLLTLVARNSKRENPIGKCSIFTWHAWHTATGLLLACCHPKYYHKCSTKCQPSYSMWPFPILV